jgi:beta-galactosidase
LARIDSELIRAKQPLFISNFLQFFDGLRLASPSGPTPIQNPMQKSIIHAAIHTAVVAATLALTFSPRPAQSQSLFKRDFAPQEGLLAPVEKRHRNEICLNGSWQFQPVALPDRFEQGKSPLPELTALVANQWEKTPIRIPSPWNVNSFPDDSGLGGDFRTYPSYPDSWKKAQMGWLRRNFSVPGNWKGKRLLLHFGAVAGATEVFVNGKSVGTHDDIFLPFDLDITRVVKVGVVNQLQVGVRKSSLRDVPGQYGRRPYQGGSFWGQHIVGIWQDVFLEAVPAVRVQDVFVKPLVDKGTLEAQITLRNDSARSSRVRVGGAAYAWKSGAGKDVLSAPEPRWTLAPKPALQLASVLITLPPGATQTVTLKASVKGQLKFWSSENPNLYGLICDLKGEAGQGVDTKYTRFGWRQMTFQGGEVRLNGQPIVMKGDSWHFMGIPQMTRRYAWAWYRAARDANLNAVRLHAQPYPTFYLDVADEMGIMVLDESAMWASDGGPKLDDAAYWADSQRHMKALVLRDRNHPSVFGWSVSNEILPVIRNVFHGPKSMEEELVKHFAIWRDICRDNDPTRVWISADGEDDGEGTLPTYVNHYGGTESMKRARDSGKPWGVGEAGPAYYGTPEEIARFSNNPRAYLSFQDRMEGVAAVSFRDIANQRQYDASFRSVFNLVWYGLKPLEIGLKDTRRAPELSDGIFFPSFVEGKPGVQPERLGPYSTTLNPGYDPRLPLYATWPLFDAIRDAQAKTLIEYKPPHPFDAVPSLATVSPLAPIASASVLAGAGSELEKNLADLGVSLVDAQNDPAIVFIDGAHPPDGRASPLIQKTLASGGTVFVWSADPVTLPALNALLPLPLELTQRSASSLVPKMASPLLSGIEPAELYFSELSPSSIVSMGLGGPFITQATPLLAANDTDWMRWNRQGEATKTAMVLRSEREAKPPGVALAELPVGPGRILVSTIPAAPGSTKAMALNRALLANLGLALGEAASQRNILDSSGAITRALVLGSFPASSLDEALGTNRVDTRAAAISAGTNSADRFWASLTTGVDANFDLKNLPSISEGNFSSTYFSFWLFSPKALDNLLLDPHLPVLDLSASGATAAQFWLNSKTVPSRASDGQITAPTLLLKQGWNHLLVKVVQAKGNWTPSLHLKSSQPEYLIQIRGAQQVDLARSAPQS